MKRKKYTFPYLNLFNIFKILWKRILAKKQNMSYETTSMKK